MTVKQNVKHGLVELGRRVTARLLEPDLAVTELEVRVRDLPPELAGFCIAQVSDLHVGLAPWGPIHLLDAVSRIEEAQPDVVVITGDFLWHRPKLAAVHNVVAPFVLPPWKQGQAPATLAITGNHDYFAGDDFAQELKAHLAGMGITVLVNQGTCIKRQAAGVSFVGLSGDGPEAIDFYRGVAELLNAGRPRVALIHEPDLARLLPPGSADIILTGHTHGGQIALPLVQPLIVRHFTGSHFTEGWYTVNDNPVYVNRGLGFTGLPIRLRSAPELTLVRMVR